MVKHHVAVIRGGPGVEYDVSMQTGSAVFKAVDTNIFEPVDIVVTKRGEWIRDGYTRFPEKILSDIDLVFIAMHGTYGEDGTLQRFLDTFGIPYVGSGALASATAINKPLTKDRLRDVGVRMAPHMIVAQESEPHIQTVVRNISNNFGPQYIVKPLDSGSSSGVLSADNSEMLGVVLKKMLLEYPEVLVEKRIQGREATCGILERFRGKERYILPPIEIVPPAHAGFFATDVKYNGETQEICPGRFSKDQKRRIEEIAALVHDTLGLSQYSRSDFMVDNDNIYFLEVNTLPGLSSESLFPKAVAAVGSSFEELVNHLLTDALEHT